MGIWELSTSTTPVSIFAKRWLPLGLYIFVSMQEGGYQTFWFLWKPVESIWTLSKGMWLIDCFCTGCAEEPWDSTGSDAEWYRVVPKAFATTASTPFRPETPISAAKCEWHIICDGTTLSINTPSVVTVPKCSPICTGEVSLDTHLKTVRPGLLLRATSC